MAVCMLCIPDGTGYIPDAERRHPLDTGWFETDCRTDYRFATSRFDDPQGMIDDLLDQSLHVSLWQLPYFVPKNRLVDEIIEQRLYVRDDEGDLPYEDAILDFANSETVEWYQAQIAGLLEMGVGAIKVDFGEAAPLEGRYHSGKTGWYEHNPARTVRNAPARRHRGR